jgi:hypothetical protein
MLNNDFPKLIFEGEFDPREEMECRDRGYRSHVAVELENGERFPVVFYDAVRLRQDLDAEINLGNWCVAEPGLILLPEVTRLNMERAVNQLAEEGYFDSLRPLSLDAAATR